MRDYRKEKIRGLKDYIKLVSYKLNDLSLTNIQKRNYTKLLEDLIEELKLIRRNKYSSSAYEFTENKLPNRRARRYEIRNKRAERDI